MTEPIRPSTSSEPFAPAATEPSPVPTEPITTPVLTSPVVPVIKRRSSGGGRWLNVTLVVAAAVAIGGIAFAFGRTTAPVSAAGFGNGRGGFVTGGALASGAPGFGRGGFGGAGLTVNGTVESISGETLTIKTVSGQTITVKTGASTTYHTQTPATAIDVQVGRTVQVQLDPTSIQGRANASAAPSGPTGTAGSVTVVPD